MERATELHPRELKTKRKAFNSTSPGDAYA